MQTRKYTSCACICGFSISGFGEQPRKCPTCRRRLKETVHRVPEFIHAGTKVDYHSVIGGPVTLEECYIESDVFLLGQTPCVMIDRRRGAVAVEALTEAR